MATIKIAGSNQELICKEGDNLLHVLIEHGIFVDNPCNGTGVCGKCKVRVQASQMAVSAMDETEQKHLKEEEIAQGIRLACMAKVCGGPGDCIEIGLLQEERKHRVLTDGYLPEFDRDDFEYGYGVAVDIGTTTVVMTLVDLRSGEEIATASRINAQKRFGLDVLTRITYEYEHGDEGIQELQKAIVESMNEMLDEVCQKAESRQMASGKWMNSPVIAVHDNKAGIQASAIRTQIREITVAANCTMTHMLLGVDARSIGRAPYAPMFTSAQECLAADIGLKVDAKTKLYCLPQVSSYIGADIVAGAYVCQLEKAKGNVLFIDIGTNGEIVLASNGKLLSCSCAAGPALEGMNIRCGMRAAEGAVEDVCLSEHGAELKVIGHGQQNVFPGNVGDKNAAPAGLCGSGILAAVRELIRKGFLKKTGAFISSDMLGETDWRRQFLRAADKNGKKREVVLWSDGNPETEIVVTQDDVRQVQLAKGAILSGFSALLKKAGISMDDLDQVLIAGQFGAHLPAESLVGVGILPEQVKDKLIYVGNSSKTGAYMALMSRSARQDMEQLAEKIRYFELAETDDYERVFAECMRFPV